MITAKGSAHYFTSICTIVRITVLTEGANIQGTENLPAKLQVALGYMDTDSSYGARCREAQELVV